MKQQKYVKNIWVPPRILAHDAVAVRYKVSDALKQGEASALDRKSVV